MNLAACDFLRIFFATDHRPHYKSISCNDNPVRHTMAPATHTMNGNGNGNEEHQEQEEYTGDEAWLNWDDDNNIDGNDLDPEQEDDYPETTLTNDGSGTALQENDQDQYSSYDHYKNGSGDGVKGDEFDAGGDEYDAQVQAEMDSNDDYREQTYQQEEVNESDFWNHPLASVAESESETESDELENHQRSDIRPSTVMHEASDETTELSYSSSQSHSHSQSRSLTVQIKQPAHEQYHQQQQSYTIPATVKTDLVPLPDYSQEGLMMTPSPTCFSNFTFLSDEISIPAEFNRVQDKAVQRRRDFQKNIHYLQYRVAALTANVAEESMDRERSLEHVQDTCIDGPKEEMVERIALQQEAYQSQDLTKGSDASNGDSTCTTNWRDLEKRLSVLDSQMTHSVHVKIQDAKREKLGTLSEVLENEITKDFKLEASKADKREGGLVRRFETLVGTMVRQYQEERATRIAALQVAADNMRDELTDPFLDASRADAAVVLLRDLRTQLEHVRAERQEQDERVMELIVQRTANMKRALLAASGGDDDVQAQLQMDSK
jgi:hypothetical protein